MGGHWEAGEFVAGPVGTLAAGGGSWQNGKWVSGPIEILGGGAPAAGSITTAMLADGAVTSAKLGVNAVVVQNLGSDVDTLIAGKTAKASFAALTALADPATATSTEIATLLNAVLAAAKV